MTILDSKVHWSVANLQQDTIKVDVANVVTNYVDSIDVCSWFDQHLHYLNMTMLTSNV